MMSFLPPLGRLLLSILFILAGLGKIWDPKGTLEYMSSKKMPAVPVLFVGAIIVEIAGGVSLLTGFYVRWGALMLIAFLIPTTLIFHNFWAVQGQERQTQMTNFLKNLAIIGGLIFVYVFGPYKIG